MFVMFYFRPQCESESLFHFHERHTTHSAQHPLTNSYTTSLFFKISSLIHQAYCSRPG